MIPAIVLMAVFSLIDFVNTFVLIRRYGVETELSPGLSYLIHYTGTPWVILPVKVLCSVLITTLVLVATRKRQSISTPTTSFLWGATIAQIIVAIYGTCLVLA